MSDTMKNNYSGCFFSMILVDQPTKLFKKITVLLF